MDPILYIRNHSHDPYYNQAFEEYVFKTCTKGTFFLLWRNNPAVVCGCHQNLFAEVDIVEALKRGVSLVRRITGGGTVYHDLGNLNYTIITDRGSKALNYEKYIDFMVQALRKLGIAASANRISDIVVDGLKVSGSAQKVTKERVLHHGTLLYNCDLGTLSLLANGQRSSFETKGIPSVPWPVTNMVDHLRPPILTTEQFAERILEAISQEANLDTVSLSAEEEARIELLARDKYQSWDWTYGNSPSFLYRRSFELNGKSISVHYHAEHGMIQEFSIQPDHPELVKTLKGQKLSVPVLREILGEFPGFSNLYEYIL